MRKIRTIRKTKVNKKRHKESSTNRKEGGKDKKR